jgi:hypothetical protein
MVTLAASSLSSAAAKASSGQVLVVAEIAAVLAASKKAAPPKASATRTNWSVGEDLTRMTAAVEGWPAAKAAAEAAGASLIISVYAKQMNIPAKTLAKYISGKRTLGVGQGKPSLLKGDEESFLVDVIRRHDRGADGLSTAQVMEKVKSVRPDLGEKQVKNLTLNMRKRNADVLTGITTAQASTTNRTNINIAQQYRFYQNIEEALAILRTRNTGVSLLTGQTFGELIDQLMFFGDETGFTAMDNKLKIIGDKLRPKHEKKSNDSRVSVSFYRCANAAGVEGPTAFLPGGTRRRAAFTNAFLEEHGAAPGSILVMTPNGYMTEEAWVKIAPSIASGIRNIVDKHNPEWWALKVVDGYVPHTTSLEAMEAYHARRILLLKEEADSSHVNQVYDQCKAKEDKHNMREAAGWMRNAGEATKGVLDCWDLMLVGLHALRKSTPESWVNSAKKVNLHPFFRVSFPEWCERITPFLQGGLNFKPATAEDKYALLPSWWHGMSPAEKKAVVIIAEAEGWTPTCVRRLYAECHVPLDDMQNLRVCILCSKENPSQLDMGLPKAATLLVLEGAAAEAQAALPPITAGLASFMVVPKSPGGTKMIKSNHKLFDHMVRLARRTTAEHSELVPGEHLDVSMRPEQPRLILNPTTNDYNMGVIMRGAGGSGASIGLSKRKLDALSAVRGQSGFLNDDLRLSKMRDQLDLAASLSAVRQEEAQAKRAKKDAAVFGLFDGGPSALAKLRSKAGVVSKLYKVEICSIAHRYFSADLSDKLKQPALASALEGLIAAQPAVLPAVILEAGAATLTEEAAAEEEIEEEEVTSSPVPVPMAAENA